MKSAQLVKAARSGDKDAIEMLYKQYRDRIWFFVSKNIDSRQAAEDIVSDTFLTAIEKLSDLRCPEAFGSWLYSIAYRKGSFAMNQRPHILTAMKKWKVRYKAGPSTRP